MEISDRKQCKETAAKALAGASYDPGKLVLIYTGVTLAVSLLCMLVELLMDHQIGQTAGLGGVGTRAILETIQTVANLGRVLLLPFWQMGYVYATMKIARQTSAEPETLLEGFRRFFPVLRLQILMTLIYSVILFVASYVGLMLFMATPLSDPLVNMDLTGVETVEELSAMMRAALTPQVVGSLLLIIGIVALVIGLPISYKLRMANYCLLDDEKGRAKRALWMSWRIMWGETLPLLKMDLSFLWFYGLEVLIVVVYYLDMILPAVGIALPGAKEIWMVVSFLVYGALNLLLYKWKKGYVDVTYAVAYETVKQE